MTIEECEKLIQVAIDSGGKHSRVVICSISEMFAAVIQKRASRKVSKLLYKIAKAEMNEYIKSVCEMKRDNLDNLTSYKLSYECSNWWKEEQLKYKYAIIEFHYYWLSGHFFSTILGIKREDTNKEYKGFFNYDERE